MTILEVRPSCLLEEHIDVILPCLRLGNARCRGGEWSRLVALCSPCFDRLTLGVDFGPKGGVFRLQLFVGFALNLGLLHEFAEMFLQLAHLAFRFLGLVACGEMGFVKRGHRDLIALRITARHPPEEAVEVTQDHQGVVLLHRVAVCAEVACFANQVQFAEPTLGNDFTEVGQMDQRRQVAVVRILQVVIVVKHPPPRLFHRTANEHRSGLGGKQRQLLRLLGFLSDGSEFVGEEKEVRHVRSVRL